MVDDLNERLINIFLFPSPINDKVLLAFEYKHRDYHENHLVMGEIDGILINVLSLI